MIIQIIQSKQNYHTHLKLENKVKLQYCTLRILYVKFRRKSNKNMSNLECLTTRHVKFKMFSKNIISPFYVTVKIFKSSAPS